ncbi:MAG TPA: sigma-54 dependent transcriptional regulator [Bryobacteraceae bacterium]|jgi:DNA-binding NtrC family response regulator
MTVEAHSETRVFLGMTAVLASPAMLRLLDTVERVARANASVLITGESGSGKELIARAVHHYSARSSRPWVDLSCAALPEHLLESELFGYDKGAFSGADSHKQGLFELAHQGTLFLDEIGELDPKMQVKLLRVLDGVPYYRLGGVKKVSADVRVVAATNQDLERAVQEGRFRNDLYHRLGQFTLQVPPLRERREDISPLAHYVLAQHDPGKTFSRRAIQALEMRPWQGNVRELRNAVIKAAVMAPADEIDAADLPPCISSTSTNGKTNAGPSGSLEVMEQRMIFDALAATGGHQQKAAARLGISRRTLTRKLKTYESERESAVS